MKKATLFIIMIVALVFMVTFSTSVNAEEDPSPTTVCKSWASTAEKVMIARQIGVPMSRLFEIAEESDSVNYTSVLKDIVVKAYDKPRYSTESMQNKCVRDFQNVIFKECIQVFRN